MSAVLTKEPLNVSPLNTFTDALTTYTIEAPGSSKTRSEFTLGLFGKGGVWNTITLETPGKCDWVYTSYGIEIFGVSRDREAFTPTLPGMGNIALTPITLSAIGTSKTFEYNTIRAIGGSKHRGSFVVGVPGMHHMLTSFGIDALGNAQSGRGFVLDAPGKSSINQPTWTRVYRQDYRVEDVSYNRFELYVGYDAMPDFSGAGQPVATAVEASMPIVWAPTLPGPGLTTVLYTVVRKRNGYGLLAFEQHPRLVEIDENGVEVLGPITAPEIIKVLDGSTSGSLQVWGRYLYEGDRNPADTWELYAKDGIDPVVGVDAPVYTTPMGAAGGLLYVWRGAADGLTPGTTYHVKIAVKRSSDGAYAESPVATITLIPLFTMDAGTTTLFSGSEYEVKA